MSSYWTRVEPFWNDLPTHDTSAYLAFYEGMPPVAAHLLTTHWVYSEVGNGGFHQLFTNATGIVVPEAVTGFRALGLAGLADITLEAAAFFGASFPREQMSRIAALDRFAPRSGDGDDWNPFDQLDDRFYSALEAPGGDAYVAAADAYASRERGIEAGRDHERE